MGDLEHRTQRWWRADPYFGGLFNVALQLA